MKDVEPVLQRSFSNISTTETTKYKKVKLLGEVCDGVLGKAFAMVGTALGCCEDGSNCCPQMFRLSENANSCSRAGP